MRRKTNLLLVLMLSFAAPVMAKGPATRSDNQIKALLIQQSISAYRGNCACPYNTASNGSSCGRRSAYSRGGGYAPLCYPEDVTRQMIADYRSQNS